MQILCSDIECTDCSSRHKSLELPVGKYLERDNEAELCLRIPRKGLERKQQYTG
jgi:hypothetical protein